MSETMKAAVPAGVTRRNILAAPLLAAMAGAYAEGARAAVPDETPVMALFREWEAASAHEEAVYEATEDEREGKKAWQKRMDIELALLKEPSRNATDVLCKVIAYTGNGIFTLDESDERTYPLWAEARALVGA